MSNALKLTALTFAILAGGMSAADAREHGPRERISFEALDTNGDGQITKQEMEERGQIRFSQADANGDGSLTRDELIAKAQSDAGSRVDKMIERMDQNGDGALSQDEMTRRRGGGGIDRMFGRVDTDDNGSISKEEFEAVEAKMKSRHGKRKKN